jgi:hypothetical protein
MESTTMWIKDLLHRRFLRQFAPLAWVGVLTLLLAGCGGGGSSSDNTNTSTSGKSNWDQMTWDQDNWS